MMFLIAIVLLDLALLAGIVWSGRHPRLRPVKEAADKLPFAL